MAKGLSGLTGPGRPFAVAPPKARGQCRSAERFFPERKAIGLRDQRAPKSSPKELTLFETEVGRGEVHV